MPQKPLNLPWPVSVMSAITQESMPRHASTSLSIILRIVESPGSWHSFGGEPGGWVANACRPKVRPTVGGESSSLQWTFKMLRLVALSSDFEGACSSSQFLCCYVEPQLEPLEPVVQS